jgi:hypothetical protein
MGSCFHIHSGRADQAREAGEVDEGPCNAREDDPGRAHVARLLDQPVDGLHVVVAKQHLAERLDQVLELYRVEHEGEVLPPARLPGPAKVVDEERARLPRLPRVRAAHADDAFNKVGLCRHGREQLQPRFLVAAGDVLPSLEALDARGFVIGGFPLLDPRDEQVPVDLRGERSAHSSPPKLPPITMPSSMPMQNQHSASAVMP